MLTQDVEFAQWAGLLEHQPGVHTVPVKLMLTGQHPEPLWVGEGLRPQWQASKWRCLVLCPHLSLRTKTHVACPLTPFFLSCQQR